jgi:uncharacterized membrane protein YgcG
MIVDLYLVYQFIKRLTTPFKDWPAYKLGIIDEKGNQLKKRKELFKVAERDAFGIFDLMILKLKKLLAKLPGGQTKLATYAAALWLVKESSDIEEYGEELTEEVIESRLNHYLNYITESYNVNDKFEMMLEDGVVNSAGSGGSGGGGNGTNNGSTGGSGSVNTG